jgi:hypothetical protein
LRDELTQQKYCKKAKYGGELFPASAIASFDGKTFLEFFQQDRDGNPKGIVVINLSEIP